jgi:hypothetical protein
MTRLQIDRHAVRLKYLYERVCDLLADPFLHSKTFRKQSNKPREFRNSNDVFVSNVTDVRLTIER